MGKRKAAPATVSTDENSDGWLSTRNKKKISHPPPLKSSRGHHLLCRPFPRSPLMTLIDDAPLPLGATKKQTSIADYFCPRLKGIPATDVKSQAVLQKQEHGQVQQNETTLFDSADAELYTDIAMLVPTPTQTQTQSTQNLQYCDFDMPPPTPTQTQTQSSQNLLYGDVDTPAPAPSQTRSYQPDHSNSKATASVSKTRKDKERCTVLDPGSVRGLEGKKSTDRHPPLSERDMFLTDDGDDDCDDDHDDTVSNAGSVRGLEGKRSTHRHPRPLQHDMYLTDTGDDDCGDDDAVIDSLQTPGFLNEMHSTLNFTESPAVAKPSSSTRSKKHRQEPSNTDDHFPVDSNESQLYGCLFDGLTDMKSLQFSLTDDESQGTQLMRSPARAFCVKENKNVSKELEKTKSRNLRETEQLKIAGQKKIKSSSPRDVKRKEMVDQKNITLRNSAKPEQKKKMRSGSREMEEWDSVKQNGIQSCSSREMKRKKMEEEERKIRSCSEQKKIRTSSPVEREEQEIGEQQTTHCSDQEDTEQQVTVVSASGEEEPCNDSLQTPEFFSSTELGSQETLPWTQQSDRWKGETEMGGPVFDDLHTPGFLLGCQEDSSSADGY